MYVFVCSGSPSHISYSASKEQTDPACPECGAPTSLSEDKIKEEDTIWYPVMYGGREGAYAQKVADVSLVELTELVQKRAQEDGEWAIASGHVGNNEDVMRRMMAWVSDPINIQQCVSYILKEEAEAERTVDFVCRDLANASKNIMGTSDRDG
jgi:hypothetical protein